MAFLSRGSILLHIALGGLCALSPMHEFPWKVKVILSRNITAHWATHSPRAGLDITWVGSYWSVYLGGKMASSATGDHSTVPDPELSVCVYVCVCCLFVHHLFPKVLGDLEDPKAGSSFLFFSFLLSSHPHLSPLASFQRLRVAKPGLLASCGGGPGSVLFSFVHMLR